MIRSVEFIFRITRNDADYAMLYPIEGSPPTLTLAESKTIRMAMNGVFADPGPDVDFLTDRIRPFVVINGTEYPLGVLLPAKVEKIITQTGHHLRIQAYDQSWLLQTTATESEVYFDTGTKYLTAIDSLLESVGIGLAIVTYNDYSFTRTREDWLPGTNYLTIINDLLEEMNYGKIWFNLDGMAVLAPEPDLLTGRVEHILDEDDVSSLLIPDGSISNDLYSTPNVFVYICSNFENSLLSATAINNSLGSPISVPRRKRKIYSINQVKDVPSADVLQDIADKAMNRSLIHTDTITVSTGILPGFGLNELVSRKIDGELSVCIERGWNMKMAPGGTMTHRMERLAG